MDASRRQQYLDAMGITRYVMREPAATGYPRDAVESGVVAPASLPESGRPAAADISELQPDWAALKTRVASCTACELHASRTRTVFGTGDESAQLMIVGEAPGAEEDRQGEPFVGRAGQLLNAMLHAIGLAREAVYITNILKCRPPGNRNPTAEEAAKCRPFLMQQLSLVKPKVMLAVGGVAAHNLLETDEAVGRLRNRIHYYGEDCTPLLVTYHPAYLLRRPEEKAKVWQDLQKLYGILHGD
ncbi:uracil-DNA glycosylase [Thiolapillus sp.]